MTDDLIIKDKHGRLFKAIPIDLKDVPTPNKCVSIGADLGSLPGVKKWPKRINMYLHGSDDVSYDKAEELGLSEDLCLTFNPLYEVSFDLLVFEDGRVEYIACEVGNVCMLNEHALDYDVPRG